MLLYPIAFIPIPIQELDEDSAVLYVTRGIKEQELDKAKFKKQGLC